MANRLFVDVLGRRYYTTGGDALTPFDSEIMNPGTADFIGVPLSQPYPNFEISTACTVTNASQKFVEGKERKTLIIQNNNLAGGVVWARFGAAATAAAPAIKINPGGSAQWQNKPPSGALYMIGSIASNADVSVQETV